MNLLSTLLLFSAMAFAPVMEMDAPATLKINKSESTVTWKAKKVTGEHFGKVPLNDSNLDYTNGRITGGSFEIDMTALTVEDITDATSNKRLTDHLKSDDFFSVANHGKSSFKITEAKTSNGKDYEIKGNLTIKGMTQPVSFPAKVETVGNKVIATAKIIFDRTKYDIKYRSGNYFENLADRLIYDDVELDVKLVAEQP